MIVSVKGNTFFVLFVSLHAFCQFSTIPEGKSDVRQRERLCLNVAKRNCALEACS